MQNFDAYKEVQTLEVVKYQEPKLGADGQPLKDAKGNPVMEDKSTDKQTLPLGPAASQIAIKQLGTNGGGFFNVNSAHPYENPTPLSNFLEMLAILLIPAALCFTFGRMVGDRRQGWAIFAAMAVMFVGVTVAAMAFEQQGNPQFSAARRRPGAKRRAGRRQHGRQGGALRHRRIGAVGHRPPRPRPTARSTRCTTRTRRSADWCRCCNMQLGEVVFGGVGSGLYGMLVFAIIAVFIAGLMIGRTPEYLGKKIEAYEMKMSSLAILIVPLLVLGGTAIAVMAEAGRAGIANPGAHGFSEILYAFTSAANNNGSAFAGLSAPTRPSTTRCSASRCGSAASA